MSEVEIKAKIEEIESMIKMLEERKNSLLKALEALSMAYKFENKFEFNPPIPKDSGDFKNFLMPKILNAHKEVRARLQQVLNYELPILFVDTRFAAELVNKNRSHELRTWAKPEDIELTMFYILNRTQKGIRPSLKDTLQYII